MLHPLDENQASRARLEKMLRDAADGRLVRTSKRPRYVRSGNGYRFIAAGQSLFEQTAESVRAA